MDSLNGLLQLRETIPVEVQGLQQRRKDDYNTGAGFFFFCFFFRELVKMLNHAKPHPSSFAVTAPNTAAEPRVSIGVYVRAYRSGSTYAETQRVSKTISRRWLMRLSRERDEISLSRRLDDTNLCDCDTAILRDYNYEVV